MHSLRLCAQETGSLMAVRACMQSAIASTPSAAWQGYLLGGMMWFCIPFTLSTSLGIATVALDLPLSTDEANMGLVPIAAASVRAFCLPSSVCFICPGHLGRIIGRRSSYFVPGAEGSLDACLRGVKS